MTKGHRVNLWLSGVALDDFNKIRKKSPFNDESDAEIIRLACKIAFPIMLNVTQTIDKVIQFVRGKYANN